MNFLARVSARNAELEAAFAAWRLQQGGDLVWPKADRVAFLFALLVLLAMFTAYGVPDTEATIWLRMQIGFWMNAVLFAGVGATALALIIWNGGKGLTIRLEEAPALPGGEQVAELPEPEDWTFPNMSPYLSGSDRVRIAQTTNPKLNEATAERVKAGLAAGLSTALISTQTGLSIDTVKKYAALIRKGLPVQDEGPALSIEL